MSCGPSSAPNGRPVPSDRLATLCDEGFRLFFPLAAIYAALWPALWVLAFAFDLPLAETVPPSLWHAHEMLVGAFGAALIGFVLTAAPEWTDTEPPRGRALLALAALWLVGRIVGVFGWDGLGALGSLVDLLWMLALLVTLARLSIRRRTDRLVGFIFWLVLVMAATVTTRFAFASGDIALADKAVRLIGLAFLGLLGLALARITVPVTNLVLDPSEKTSPFRPHPGRLHLAPALVFLAMAGDIADLGAMVTGFLWFAAGAAFMDRVAEAFIGRAAFRAEILSLGGAAALAGAGLMMIGASRLGAPAAEVTGLHVAFMGGLGLGVYAVFSIAGLLHTGRPLGLSRLARSGALLLVASVGLRIAPDLGAQLPGRVYGLSAAAWGAGFLIRLAAYWPFVSKIEQARDQRPEEQPPAAAKPERPLPQAAE
ncbi:MAG: NnrS family protein [Pseudomonadota bacterium]